MTEPADFKFLENFATYRPRGRFSFTEVIAIVAEGLSFATAQRVERLLLDTTGLTGFTAPSTWERFVMAEQWASHSSGFRLAVVARPELVDPARFGVTVARNRGLFTNVFTSEKEAIDWLLNPDPT